MIATNAGAELSDGPDPNCRYCRGTGFILNDDGKTRRPCLCDLDPPDDGVTTRRKYRKPRP